jgi:hypothetical protein
MLRFNAGLLLAADPLSELARSPQLGDVGSEIVGMEDSPLQLLGHQSPQK